MPAYNAEKYISEAIDSILAQTVGTWKLIIVNDCSTDSTLSIAENYAMKDERIKVISMDAPSGSAYEPRKKGILEADTKWVAPLDADDVITPSYIEKLLLKQETTDADIVYPSLLDLKTKKSLIKSDLSLPENGAAGRDLVSFTLDGWKINCGGGLLSRSLYLKVFKTYGSYVSSVFADEILTRQLLFYAPRVALSDAVYYYRANPSSVTRKTSVRQFDFLLSNQVLLQFTKDNFGEDSKEYLLAQRQNFHGIFNGVRMLNNRSLSKEDTKKVRSLIKKSSECVDKKLLKNHVSTNYMILLRSGFFATSLILKIKDRFC